MNSPLSHSQDKTRKEKSYLRAYFAQVRQSLSDEDFIQAAKQITLLLQQIPAVHSARSVAGYAALPDEIDLSEFYSYCLENGKKLYFPRFNQKTSQYEICEVLSLSQLEAGKFGVKEPLLTCRTISEQELNNTIDIWLVPGRGFDKLGRRIGRGLGYYDRLLLPYHGVTIGIAHMKQVLSHRFIPLEPHDKIMNMLVTNEQMYYIR